MTDWTSNSEWIVMRGNQMFQMCRLCFEPIHDGPCEKSAAMIEYWNARAADADANAARCRGMAMEIANRQLSELSALRAALAQAQQDRDSQQAEIKDLYERLACENAEVTNCLKNIAELTTQRLALQLELSDAREELRLIKQTTRPVPGGLLDEKNQHGEYSMDSPPFDYALYGIAGEPQHDTSGKPCWCGAKADGEGVVVHRDMAEVLTAARQLGRFDAHPDYAAARSAVESELRAIAHIYGTAAGLEPLDSVPGMLSQISNIIAGVASQRDAATARAEKAEAVTKRLQLYLGTAINDHRDAVYLTCPEDCWCHDADSILAAALAGPEGGER